MPKGAFCDSIRDLIDTPLPPIYIDIYSRVINAIEKLHIQLWCYNCIYIITLYINLPIGGKISSSFRRKSSVEVTKMLAKNNVLYIRYYKTWTFYILYVIELFY